MPFPRELMGASSPLSASESRGEQRGSKVHSAAILVSAWPRFTSMRADATVSKSSTISCLSSMFQAMETPRTLSPQPALRKKFVYSSSRLICPGCFSSEDPQDSTGKPSQKSAKSSMVDVCSSISTYFCRWKTANANAPSVETPYTMQVATKNAFRIFSRSAWSSSVKLVQASKASSCCGAITKMSAASSWWCHQATEPMASVTKIDQYKANFSKRKCNMIPTPPEGINSLHRLVRKGYNLWLPSSCLTLAKDLCNKASSTTLVLTGVRNGRTSIHAATRSTTASNTKYTRRQTNLDSGTQEPSDNVSKPSLHSAHS
mmetsp:Transcript_45247/g.145008  ORF Transcript_45247/g.145008 Transcript_45247/m.145008 type:complete len:317 (-) Transcript_45247:571-1521(-)